MANLNKIIRDEMTQVSRSVWAQEVEKLRSENIEIKRAVSHLSKRLRDLERSLGRPLVPGQKDALSLIAGTASEDDLRREKTTGPMVKQLREKLGVSQRELGLLLGVSAQAVYLWESRKGRLNLRSKARAAMFEIKKISPEEALRRLAVLDQ